MREKDPWKVEMGLRFRKARERMGWTREQLAERSELPVPFLAALELGNTGIRLEYFQRLCGLLHVSADYILFGETQTAEMEVLSLLRGRDERTLHIARETLRGMLNAMDAD